VCYFLPKKNKKTKQNTHNHKKEKEEKDKISFLVMQNAFILHI